MALVIAKRMVKEGRAGGWPVHIHDGLAKFKKHHFENRELERVMLGKHIAHADIQAAMCRLRADQHRVAAVAMQAPVSSSVGHSTAPALPAPPSPPAAQSSSPAIDLDVQKAFLQGQGKNQGK